MNISKCNWKFILFPEVIMQSGCVRKVLGQKRRSGKASMGAADAILENEDKIQKIQLKFMEIDSFYYSNFMKKNQNLLS
jgi:hypothetical protein